MTTPTPEDRFTCSASFDQPELLSARWWHDGMRRAPAPERSFAKIAFVAGVLGMLGVVFVLVNLGDDGSSSTSTWSSDTVGQPLTLERRAATDTTVERTAFEAQRSDGWDVGTSDAPLEYPSACEVDAAGGAFTQGAVTGLAEALVPAHGELTPWYVPTLLQSVELPANARLRSGLKPVFSEPMAAAFGRGAALRELFAAVDAPSDVAVVVDLPGPESVAFAAGLAPTFDTVFVLDNWPHPRGVVPAHLTLAACVYYRAWFAAHRASATGPASYVLDRNRLADYRDDAGRFDNRYLAKLPPAESLASQGVRHVLYVVPEGATQELDDLNAQFVAYGAANIDVKLLPLSDLTPEGEAPVPAVRAGATPTTPYRYGGSSVSHPWFWRHYGWYGGRSMLSSPAPTTVSRGYEFAARPRTTLFSGGTSAAPVAPKGFGTVTFHKSATTGSSSGRSGSFGRGSSFSG